MLALLNGCIAGTEVASRSGQEARALVELGMGYLRQGQLLPARENFVQALSVDRRFAPAHNGLALVFQLEQESALAEAHFLRAIASDPEFYAARNNYGAFLFAEKRYAEAIGELELTVANPHYKLRSQAYENLGVAYLRTGRSAEAEQAFTNALALNPAQARALLELAQFAFDLGLHMQARDYLNRHKRVSGDSASSLWLGFRVARKMGEDGREEAQMLKVLFPASQEYQRYRKSQDEY